MSAGVQNILDKIIGDGARSTKYEVYFSFVDSAVDITEEDLIYMGKTASFPGKSHTPVNFSYKGRKIPIKGQVKYTQVWDCSFYLTEDHRLKHAIENWLESLDNIHYDASVNKGLSTAISAKKQSDGKYVTDIHIFQKDFDGVNNRAKYVLHNAYPTNISNVATDTSATSNILEFAVTFSFSHYTMEILTAEQGNFVDNLNGKALNIVQQGMNALTSAVTSALSSATSASAKSAHGGSTEGDAIATSNTSSTPQAGILSSLNSFLSGFK